MNFGPIAAFLASRKITSSMLGHKEVKWDFLDLIICCVIGKKENWEKRFIKQEQAKMDKIFKQAQDEMEDIEARAAIREEEWGTRKVAKNGIRINDFCILNDCFSSHKGGFFYTGQYVIVKKIYKDGNTIRVQSQNARDHIDIGCNIVTYAFTIGYPRYTNDKDNNSVRTHEHDEYYQKRYKDFEKRGFTQILHTDGPLPPQSCRREGNTKGL